LSTIAQIRSDDAFVLTHNARHVVGNDTATVEHDDPLRNGHDQVDVVLHKQNREPRSIA